MNEGEREQSQHNNEESLASHELGNNHRDEEHEQASDAEVEQEQWPQPRIYVASLADYVAGRLHGEWVDAAQSAEELHAAISAMLARSPEPGAEEWAIHDTDGFGPLRLSEYESIEKVATVAHGIAEHGPAFAAWASLVGIGEEEELARFEECYLGEWDSLTAYAEQYVEDIGVQDRLDEVAGPLAPYVSIDTEALGRDFVLGGDISEVDAPDGGMFLYGQ